MHALPLMLGTLAAMAIAYRFYSKFLAFTIARLDDTRTTPAHRLNDGQNYDPTNKWVLFGHHFAAISGAGPLIGPVLAIQFGYMPGFIWLLVGVCLAGAVQDMLVLACSVRNDGKSLAELARRSLGASSGSVASVAIFFIVIIALSGLGVVVVKALGGESVRMPAGTTIAASEGATHTITSQGTAHFADIAPNATVTYPTGATLARSGAFRIKLPSAPKDAAGSTLTLPEGSMEIIKGSSWGMFTIACTIPIALFVGLYLYRIRKGRVMEASIIGAAGVLFATFAGNWIPGSFLEPWFSLSREGCITAICVYGFIASVLPVWLLLCPRDYISSILKIGTLFVLVASVLIANPTLHAPAVNPVFVGGGGPYFNGAVFPFVFICIMCGAISGFHSLVSSGTTPKMINRESDIRAIGYGSMLLEGLVAIVALIAAASLPEADYWAINIDLASVEKYTKVLPLGAGLDHLPVLEEQVGGETLRGRTGGAVTLAVGMSQIMSNAIARFNSSVDIGGLMKYWYHFAIMFEALFILTTIDAGTRIARFLLQEILAKFIKPMERVDWLPGVIFGSAVVSVLWGGLIWTGSIATIWPMFGIANQLLAAIALIVVTTILFEGPNRKYIWVTLLPLAFVSLTSISAAIGMLQDKFIPAIYAGYTKENNWAELTQGIMTSGATIFLLLAYAWILANAIKQWTKPKSAVAESHNRFVSN